MRIIIVDGIDTSQQRSGVAEQAADELSRRLGPDTRCEWVDWPAAMIGVGGTGTWVDNAAAGLAELHRTVLRDDDRLVLIAYSGGNRVVHDYLSQHPEVHPRIAAVGLVSDPFRPRGRWLPGTPDPGGWGVCGQDYGPLPERTVWCAAEGDAVTCAAWDSLLRTGADLGATISERRLAGALAAFREHLDAGSFQLHGLVVRDPVAWTRELGRRVAEARVDIDRYFDGWHTEHYTDPYRGGPSLVQRMCAELAALVAREVPPVRPAASPSSFGR